MPVSLTDLLAPAQIRSVLTVSQADLPDATLRGYGLEDDIGDELDRVYPTWEAETETNKLRKLRLFVKYRAASIVAATAPVFVLKKMTDGNNEGQRSDHDGFLWLSKSLGEKADAYLADLLDTPATAGAFALVGRVIPTRDPITQPRGTTES